MHQGYPKETLVRFLKAREWNVAKAHKMVTFHTSFSTVGKVTTNLITNMFVSIDCRMFELEDSK
jgi:hypothetical protein